MFGKGQEDESTMKWQGMLNGLVPEVQRRVGYEVRLNHPVTASGMRADAVVEGPDQVIIVEHLPTMGSTGQVATSGFPMARMALDSARKQFPGKQVRFVYFPTTEVPDSVKDVVKSFGAEVAGLEEAPADFIPPDLPE